MYLCKFWFRWFWYASSRLGMATIQHYWHTQRERERDDSIMYLLLCVLTLCVCVCVCVPGIWISMWNWWCGLRTTNVYVWCTDPPLSLPSCLLLLPCPLLFDSMCIERRYAHHADMILKTLKTWRLEFSLSSAFWQLPFQRIVKTMPQQRLSVLRSSTTMMGGRQILDKFQTSVFTTKCCSQQTLIVV